MIDRQKVIKALDLCKYDPDPGQTVKYLHSCVHCPYWNDGVVPECSVMYTDAIALLKEQEAVKPHYNARTYWYECGACHYSMTSGMHCRSELIPAYKVGFCAKCGQAVKWE